MTIKRSNKKELPKDLLMFQLKERYESMHTLRGRTQTICLRILGIMLGISGWLAQGNLTFSCCEKCASILLLIIFAIIFVLYFENQKKGWLAQHKLAISLEQRLGLFEGVLPDDFDKNKSRPFLNYHYLLLGYGIIVLFICILYFT